MLRYILYRTLLFVLIATLALGGWWLAAVCAYLLALRFYNPYECIIFAFCIDVYFSPMGLQLWYTAGSVTLLFLAMILRPYMRKDL